MKTLVLVDAQQKFWENASKVESEIKAVLKKAELLRQRVIVLEYTLRTYGRTHSCLQECLENMVPRDVCYVEKHMDDGSDRILQAMRGRDWPVHDGFEICGVNLCYCVAETAISLAAEKCKVELIRPACACWNQCDCSRHEDAVISRYTSNGVRINGKIG